MNLSNEGANTCYHDDYYQQRITYFTTIGFFCFPLEGTSEFAPDTITAKRAAATGYVENKMVFSMHMWITYAKLQTQHVQIESYKCQLASLL